MGDGLITEARFANGRWTGFMASAGAQSVAPEIGVLLDGQDLGDVSASVEGDSRWKLEFSIPPDALGDGVSTFLFVDRQSSEPLGRFCIISGKLADQDVLVQLDALQSELNQLKAAFRREVRRNRSDK